ncbi:hypothetical protein [Sinosporangium siamense]|nr:hypothetical protein [Sinosporangium siamense]
MTRTRNERLATLLAEAGWSRAQATAAYNRVVREAQHTDCATIGRSHVSMWVGGTMPSGMAPLILCQALSRHLRREITPDELGFAVPRPAGQRPARWDGNPVTALTELGRTDLDANRRDLLAGAVYSAVSLALPDAAWWRAKAEEPTTPHSRRQRCVHREDVLAVRQLTTAFSNIDQLRGGGHGRKALVQYLNSDVAALLRGTFPNEQVKRDMFAAASELAYLSGWMAFDNNEQVLAQKYFHLALRLAAPAAAPPLAGHILRAMAHQAVDLGFYKLSLELSAASVEGQRYRSATPRERALLGVVHARGLAATGQGQAAAKALLRAEDDLLAAGDAIEEPSRMFFFTEASLAHETACALRDSGDHQGAIREFRRSAQTRGTAFRRTHAVTLGYLGAAQIAAGHVEGACATWGKALDAMEEGIHSSRARKTIVDMRNLLSPFRRRRIPLLAELDARGASYLAHVD